MPDENNNDGAQEHVEQRRLDRLFDALPAFSGYISPDGYLSRTRPETGASFLWDIPAFSYAHDSVTQIIDLCDVAASGRRVQVERPYRSSVSEQSEDYRQGLLTLSPIFDENDYVEEIAISLIDCEAAGMAPIDPFAKSRLKETNTRIGKLLSLAQTVVEASQTPQTEPHVHRDRLTRRLDVLASIIDSISQPETTHVPLQTLIKNARAVLPSSARTGSLRPPQKTIQIPIQTAPVLSLLLHELFDNGARHGAWRDTPDNTIGIITIDADILDSAFGRTLHLSWSEDQGPSVPALLDRGFGFTLAERLYPQMTGGTVTFENAEDGVRWSFTLPLPEDGTNPSESIEP